MFLTAGEACKQHRPSQEFGGGGKGKHMHAADRQASKPPASQCTPKYTVKTTHNPPNTGSGLSGTGTGTVGTHARHHYLPNQSNHTVFAVTTAI